MWVTMVIMKQVRFFVQCMERSLCCRAGKGRFSPGKYRGEGAARRGKTGLSGRKAAPEEKYGGKLPREHLPNREA